MADQQMVIVHQESDEAAARIVVGFLKSLGIEAQILEDDAGDQIPAFEATHGVKVFVPATDAERAREALNEHRTSDDGS